MSFSTIIDLIKALLPSVLVALFGLLLLRRLEEIKSEVARRSNFNQKWADLFFDASNTFMIAAERIMTYASLLTVSTNRNDSQGMKWQQEMISALEVLVENKNRIDRLSTLATSKGADSRKAAEGLYQEINLFFDTKQAKVQTLAEKIASFNRAVRDAHSEMIALR